MAKDEEYKKIRENLLSISCNQIDIDRFGDFFEEKNEPLLYLVSDVEDSENNFATMVNNLNKSFQIIVEKDKRWIDKKINEMIKADCSGVSSILGEIRTYGKLLEMFCPNTVNTATEKDKKEADFNIRKGEEPVSIEVNTLQINGDERDKLKDNRNTDFTKKRCEIYEKEIIPYGIKGDTSITRKAISKLSKIKDNNSQVNIKYSSIIWVDLQDQHMSIIADRIEKPFPYFISSQAFGNDVGFYSNELWYSLYAKKGTHIFEGQTTNSGEGHIVNLNKMDFDAKFYRKDEKNISGVIFNLPKGFVIFENPNCIHKLPRWFVKTLLLNNSCIIDSSRIDFEFNPLKQQIKRDYRIIKRLAKFKFYSW